MRKIWIRGAMAAVCLVPAIAAASGLNFTENGMKALGTGGAFAGQADDLTAIQHNPAGLALQPGTRFLLEAQLLNNDFTFQRAKANVEPIHNIGGIFLLPFGAASHGLKVGGRQLTFALGMYPPPAVGRYMYPAPDYTKNDQGRYTANPNKFAPQRYMLVQSDTIVAYPGLSVGYDAHRLVKVGVSLQYVWVSLFFKQTLTTSDALGVPNENPDFDALATVKMDGRPAFTAIPGVLVSPTERLRIGASFRPPVFVSTAGTMKVTLGETVAAAGAKVLGEKAEIDLTLPMEAKLGVHYRPIDAVGINADIVYTGWQAFSELVLRPIDIQQQVGDQDPVPLGEIRLAKKWKHTWSGRAGGSYKFGFGLEARAGVMYEEQAAPNEYFNIDFPHMSRVWLTAGASYPIGPIEVVAVGAYTPSKSFTVESSAVYQVTSNASVQGVQVGNGTYTAGGWVAGVGFRGHFGAKE